MAKVRLSLTLPGAVSLGAYEGGALAALLVAVQTLGQEVLLVDSIGSASAGSITGLLAARALLRRADPIALLTKAWVELASFQAMKTHSTDAPLSSEALTAIAVQVLGPDGVPDGPEPGRQQEPVRLSMALTSLAGLTYALPVLARNTTVTASTFIDWYDVTLTGDQGPGDYLALADAAIASGANAIGFPPKLLDRSASRDAYLSAGLQGFPADGKFWYTDGGTVDNEPIGRTIDLAQQVGSTDDRVFLLVHPAPATPSPTTPTMWSGDAPRPPWLSTGTHAVSISRSQGIYDDLRQLEKTNSRLQWSKLIVTAVQSGLNDGISDLGLSDEQAGRLRSAMADAATQALQDVRSQQARTEALAHRSPQHRVDPGGGDYGDILGRLVGASTGLEGKDPVTVEVVSPTIDPAVTEPPAAQLAGDFLFHFGGFLEVRFRQSDFALGYRNMRYWLAHGLPSYLPGVDLAPCLSAVDTAYAELGWDGIRLGGAKLADLGFGDKWELAELAAHVSRVVIHDLRTADR
jgi:predicted acylesterase/phospholipase RssA